MIPFPAFVPKLLANWRLILAGLAVVAVITAVLLWRADVRRLAVAAERADRLEQVVAGQQAEVDRLNHLLFVRDQAVAKLNASNRKLTSDLDSVRRRIATAPAGDDAPPAPVLRDAIESLRAPR